MAIFAKDAAARPSLNGVGAQGDATISVIAAGTRIVGDIESGGILKIEGALEGNVRRAHQLLLGKQGTVRGDVAVREVVVGGIIDGRVTAEERVEIQGGATVNGDVRTRSLVVHEGATINGAVTMREGEEAAPQGSPQPVN